MRTLVLLLSAIAVIGLASWAYRENYATQLALRDAARLQAEVRELREAIGVHRAEWAYLNRPDRLSDLVMKNFTDLPLLPMTPAQFASLAELPLARTPPSDADAPDASGARYAP